MKTYNFNKNANDYRQEVANICDRMEREIAKFIGHCGHGNNWYCTFNMPNDGKYRSVSINGGAYTIDAIRMQPKGHNINDESRQIIVISNGLEYTANEPEALAEILETLAEITFEDYTFAPAYYEWHFCDFEGRVLLNWVDPGENFWIYEDEDGNELAEPRPMTYDEVLEECRDYIRGGDFAFERDDEEEFAGVSRELWAELPENAAEIMAKAIYYYYCYEPEEQEAA